MNKTSAGDKRFCRDACDVDATASNHHGIAFNQSRFVVVPGQVHRQGLAALAASNDNGVVLFCITHLDLYPVFGGYRAHLLFLRMVIVMANARQGCPDDQDLGQVGKLTANV